ncbi:hypothetical protein [Niabella drilacis]|uniref:Uncharacterized protein n=1 Tax=Niabella drilacis (strain DSM 25811 / CCM 8410 / CCUG 62505 / LMG 26954 / E90) TaxID=1285928 RepID=A0A1G6JBB9_NIADE|nr:hypothetical protein [Niabella drilacis]SDC16182.1 hypothetical protein SAMN04487894_101487 [Niabella drilacis]
MKTKLPKDPFDTACWSRGGITDPRQILAEVFNCSDIETLRTEIKQIVSYAQVDKLYKDHSPCDVLLDMKMVRSVLKAAHALKDEKISPVAVSANDIFDKSYYCSPHSKSGLWSDFPRCLSRDEFCNPYRVLKKFFKKQSLSKWVQDWEAMTECALSRHSCDTDLGSLQFYMRLVKLVEAAYLIDVREVTHIGRRLKNRFADQ